jgi:hypothetical protein
MDPEIIRRASEELRTFGYVTEETRKTMEELSKAQKVGKEIFAVLFNTAKAYTKEMYSGQQGAAAFNSSIDAASSSLQKWLRLIPVVGDELADLAGAASDTTKELNLLSDRLFTTYQALSKFGLAASDGMAGVADAAQRLGYGLDEVGLQNFTKLMADSSTTLAKLGGSAVEGRKRFLELATIVRSSAGTELRMLGMSVEEINETTADYIKLQTRLGFAQNMSTEQMRKGAVDFARELDILAKLTGEQKDQLRSTMEQAQNEQRFRARLELLRRQGDNATAKNIQFLNATVAKEAPTLSKGLRDIIAAGGAVTSDAAAEAMQATGGRIQDIAQRALRGEDYVGLFNDLAAATGTGTERFLEVAAQTDLPGVFGNLAENMNLSNRRLDKEGRMRDKLTGELVKQVNEADPAVKAQVDLRTSQMNARDSLQTFVSLGVNPATRALQALAGIPEAATGALPGETAGGAMPGGGGVIGTIKRFFGGGTAAPAAGGQTSQQDLERMGLRIKTGDVQAEGATVDPKTLQLAQAVQSSIQGFNYFSGFNDRFHQENAPSSTHTKGAAFDFTLSSRPTKEQGEQIVKNLMAMGAVKAIDEYNNPSRGSTGGHFHVQALAKGGITQGPSIAGEAGPEAVVPLPDGKSIPVKLDKEIFLGGIGSHGTMQQGGQYTGNLFTDRKLTDMIMQRLGLGDLESKLMINKSGISTNVSMMGADFGSAIAGGMARDDITNRVADLVESGKPLNEALQTTLKEFQAAMQELIKSQGGATEGENMQKLMMDLRDLQQQQNAMSRQMLQRTGS